MKHTALSIAIAGFLVAGCNHDVTGPEPADEFLGPLPSETRGVVIDNLAPPESELRTIYLSATRSELGGGVAHYQFDVPLGPDDFDVVRIHRVVRERRPHRPISTNGAVFMTHGASLNFEAPFVRAGAAEPNARTSAAIYLAKRGIDVWGLDFAWTKVPLETSDFSFFQDWGLERDVDHTLAALSIARAIRKHTGQGGDRMNVLGYSYGVGVIYAAAGRETQQHRFERDIRGIVPVDQVIKWAAADEGGRLVSCGEAAALQDLIDNGVYENADGTAFAFLSGLATSAPDDPSPVIPGLTNFQAVLFIGTNTFLTADPPTPFWHFVAGDFDEFGIPQGLLYADPARWVTLGATLSPYMPLAAQLDLRIAQCDEDDTSIDDYLGEIRVPILYIGAQGAFGREGHFTSSLTASKDVTNYTVSLQPEDQRIIDYGHGDLFIGDDAASLVWEVLRRWLVRHHRPVHRRRPHYARAW